MSIKLIEVYDEETSRLLPCPWCGPKECAINPPQLGCYISKGTGVHYCVSCVCCGAEARYYDETKEAAIITWNTRYTIGSAEESRIIIKAAIKALEGFLPNDDE